MGGDTALKRYLIGLRVVPNLGFSDEFVERDVRIRFCRYFKALSGQGCNSTALTSCRVTDP